MLLGRHAYYDKARPCAPLSCPNEGHVQCMQQYLKAWPIFQGLPYLYNITLYLHRRSRFSKPFSAEVSAKTSTTKAAPTSERSSDDRKRHFPRLLLINFSLPKPVYVSIMVLACLSVYKASA